MLMTIFGPSSKIKNLVKNGTTNYTVPIKDMFTTDLKNDCPIVSYSIVKVIDKNSRELIKLADSSKKFKLDSLGSFSVLESN